MIPTPLPFVIPQAGHPDGGTLGALLGPLAAVPVAFALVALAVLIVLLLREARPRPAARGVEPAGLESMPLPSVSTDVPSPRAA
jgi:hypothetical protein